MKTRSDGRINPEKREESFGVLDDKGREVGAEALLFEETYREISEKDAGYWYTRNAPGHYFGFRPWTTRNGKPFGSVRSSNLFKTPKERDKAVDKYLKRARTRAVKKWGKS